MDIKSQWNQRNGPSWWCTDTIYTPIRYLVIWNGPHLPNIIRHQSFVDQFRIVARQQRTKLKKNHLNSSEPRVGRDGYVFYRNRVNRLKKIQHIALMIEPKKIRIKHISTNFHRHITSIYTFFGGLFCIKHKAWPWLCSFHKFFSLFLSLSISSHFIRYDRV